MIFFYVTIEPGITSISSAACHIFLWFYFFSVLCVVLSKRHGHISGNYKKITISSQDISPKSIIISIFPFVSVLRLSRLSNWLGEIFEIHCWKYLSFMGNSCWENLPKFFFVPFHRGAHGSMWNKKKTVWFNTCGFGQLEWQPDHNCYPYSWCQRYATGFSPENVQENT